MAQYCYVEPTSGRSVQACSSQPVSSTSCGPFGLGVSYVEYSGLTSHANLATMVATPRTVVGQAWYLDSGAIAHMTNDASKLVQTQPYEGSGKVVIGDCRSISIFQIGSSNLNSLAVNDVLHVHQIHKKLLSVSRFTKNNNVYFEIHPTCFYVKELHTH